MEEVITLEQRISFAHRELTEVTKELSFIESQMKQLKNREQQLIGKIQTLNDLKVSENGCQEVINPDSENNG